MFPDNRYMFIDMQLCDLDLKQYIQGARIVGLVHEDAQLKELQICNIMRQISLGVGFIHAQGEIHRDLKPHNSIFEYST